MVVIVGFNSQRDGILPGYAPPSSQTMFSFNSQRDGILLGNVNLAILSTAFQFPTGWNSTKGYPKSWRCVTVSIPNGMEFYKIGIVKRRATPNVSIPNGMEFYKKLQTFKVTQELFQFPTGWNSTCAFDLSSRCNIVSIPNGMEFYVVVAPLFSQKMLVSIPNGMEFYTFQTNRVHSLQQFQFPTGWNSTNSF